ncbi:MAG: hypothetical protein ABIK12_08570 [Pseudomonadota bacterium]
MTDFHALALRPIIDCYGQPFSYTPPGAEEPAALAPEAKAVFRERHTPLTPEPVDVEVSLMGCWLLVDLADFIRGEPEQGGLFEIVGRSFEATDIQPTGNGGARVPLLEVEA